MSFQFFVSFGVLAGYQGELEGKLADAQTELIRIKKDQERLIIETEKKAKEQADQDIPRLQADMETLREELSAQARELEQAKRASSDYKDQLEVLEELMKESNEHIEMQQREIGTMVSLKVKGVFLASEEISARTSCSPLLNPNPTLSCV